MAISSTSTAPSLNYNRTASYDGYAQEARGYYTGNKPNSWDSMFNAPQFRTQLIQLLQQLLSLLQQNRNENNPNQPLNLSPDQLSRLGNALFKGQAFPGGSPSVARVLDRSGDGRLSAGDVAVIRQFNEQTGRYDTSSRILTPGNIQDYYASK